MLPPGVPGEEWLKPYRPPTAAEPEAAAGPAPEDPEAEAGA